MTNKKIAITIGDPNGIGTEIVIKSLMKLNLAKNDIILIANERILRFYENLLQIKLPFDYEIAEIPYNIADLKPSIETAESGEFAFNTIKKSCELALDGRITAIVTAPVSKSAMNKASHDFSGQTEVLEKFLANGNQKAEMLFCANDFRILLLTRHIALKEVPNVLTKNFLVDKITALNKTFKNKFNIEFPKFALCGLNPHAGEKGLLGNEEETVFAEAVQDLRKENILITDAQPADALFSDAAAKYVKNEKMPYDCYIACYHDQGLIPIKMLAQKQAVNTTIGLDFIRTSPAHGTAYDIAGKGVASEKSMIAAINFVQKIC